MKSKVIAIIAGAVVAGLMLAGSVSAMNSEDSYRGSNATLEQSKVVDGAYYTSGDTITITGTVNGDVYCAGKTIIVTGKVKGDVICAGQNVKINGSIDGDVRVAGQTVTIDGTVSRNVTVFGDVIDIAKTAVISQDLNGAGATVTVDGKIGRDVTLGAQTMTIMGSVGRDVGVDSENLSISQGASVLGWVRYTGQNEATIADGTVSGEVKYTKKADHEATQNTTEKTISSFIYMLFALAILSVGVMLIMPQHINAIVLSGKRRLGMSILVGVFLLLAAPITLVLIGLTIVGIPFALVLGVAWLLIMALSYPVFAYYIGRLLLTGRTNNVLYSVLVGAVVLAVAYIIPIVNVLVCLASLIIGSGMIGLYVLERLKKPNYKIK